MSKKYILFVLAFFICFSTISVKAYLKSAQFIEGKGSERYEVNKEKFMNMIEEMKNQND